MDIEKFIPERCVPEFTFDFVDFDETKNETLWSPSIFWMFDGKSCERDIIRFSRMSIRQAVLYYGEIQVSNIHSLDTKFAREQFISPNSKTLTMIVEEGDLWWAPVPNSDYQTTSGRDLNLEVINRMMVRSKSRNLMRIN